MKQDTFRHRKVKGQMTKGHKLKELNIPKKIVLILNKQ